MDYGYIRVSTIQQDLEVQREWVKSKGVIDSNIFEDKASGKNAERDGLQKLKEVLQKGDRLFVFKLDRLSRDTKSSLDLMDYFRKNGIMVVFGDIGVVDDSEVGDLIYTIFSAVATMERRRIVERTRAGREYKRKHDPNYREGRKNKLNPTASYNLFKRYKMGETITELAREYNMSRTTIYKYINEEEAKEELQRYEEGQ